MSTIQPIPDQSVFLRLPAFADHLRCSVCGSRRMEAIDRLYLLPADGGEDSLTVAVVACPDCHHVRLFLADEM